MRQTSLESSMSVNIEDDVIVAGASSRAGQSPIVDFISRSIAINSINCCLRDAELRWRRLMRQAARSRRRLVCELAMRCPPLSIYGPATGSSSPADDEVQTDQFVWNHDQTRPFDAVDAIGSSHTARLITIIILIIIVVVFYCFCCCYYYSFFCRR